MPSKIFNARLPYVYLIRHISSGKFYAGSRTSKTCHPNDFWTSYFTSSKIVKDLIVKDGRDSFEILEIIPRPLDDALEYEVALLKSVNAAKSDRWLNRSNGAKNFATPLGLIPHNKGKIGMFTHSYETRERISKANKGKLRTDAQKLNYSNGQLGKPKSANHKEKLRLANLGKKASPETRAKNSAVWKGRTHSTETRQKLSEWRMGKPHPQQTVSCPHCVKVGALNNMKRYHFDNCKFNCS